MPKINLISQESMYPSIREEHGDIKRENWTAVRTERLVAFEVSNNVARSAISMACEVNSSEPRREREEKGDQRERKANKRER